MSTTARRAEFFALEAAEYLSELEPIAARSDQPDVEQLIRGARALRGASLMAGLGTFARASAGLEGIARQVRDHALEWNPAAHMAWREGLQTLRGLVSRATTWEAADDRQALALADRLERVADGKASVVATTPKEAPITTPTSGLTPGVRAFIARESSLIAGSLQQAAHALDPTPPALALAGVLDRMRSLRGIGGSAELSPLPELLDAMEVMTRNLLGEGPPSPKLAELFAAAAEALNAMAKSVSEHGRVTVPPTLGSVAETLLTEHLVPPPTLSRRSENRPEQLVGELEPIPIELVGVGDHLIAQGTLFGQQSSPSARDLRLFVLHRTLCAMPPSTGTGQFLSPLVRAITTTIAEGSASNDPDGFSAMLSDAGRFLVDAGEARDPALLASQRDGLADAIMAGNRAAPDQRKIVGETRRTAPASDYTVGEPEPGVSTSDSIPANSDTVDRLATTPIVRIESLAPNVGNHKYSQPVESAQTEPLPSIEELAPDPEKLERTELVDIESLAPDLELHDVVVPIESLILHDSEPIEDLPLMDELLVEPTALDTVGEETGLVSISSLAPNPVWNIPDDAPGLPSRLESAYRSLGSIVKNSSAGPASLDALVGEFPVSMESLLYRGDSAITRAEELRVQLANILAEPTVSLDRLRPLLDELLDLVPLARDAA